VTKGERPAYLDPSQPVERRVDDLLSRMTLEEKVGQMCQYSGFSEQHESMIREGRVGSLLNVFGAENVNRIQRIAVEHSRLGVPLIFGLDVLHGYVTTFPIPLGLASTWDPEVVKRAASAAALEASSDGINWTFAPMVDIARDPRWGRIAEGAGEDPYLGSVMARALVEGFQGEAIGSPGKLLACPKHFVAYGAAEGGRDYNTVDISERTLREVYLPPFKAAVEAGAGTIMSAFNEISGIPASANHFTLGTVLRGEWGFDGFVVSDYNSIGELVNHGIASTPSDAAREAIMAGVDMDMQGNVYQSCLVRLVMEGIIPEEAVDEAVRRILRIKFRLGLFERPYVDAGRPKEVIMSKGILEVALEAARKSIVLLKNEGRTLPLRKGLRRIAVIGPLADDRKAPLGPWSCLGRPEYVVTVLEGIRKKASPDVEVVYAKGCEVTSALNRGLEEAADMAKGSDVAVVVVGEEAEMSGEAACRASLDLPGVQEELVRRVHETGVPVVEVLMNGRPLSIAWSAEHVPAILEVWFPGIQGGNAIAEVLFGDYNPGGKLPVTFPRTVGQVPIYYNHKNTGRPPSEDKWTSRYLDVPFTPLFPFGHGLSYTEFEYSALKVEPEEVALGGHVRISLDLRNVGRFRGDEVVQLYIRDVVASVTRPVKELKGFRRVTLEPNEMKRLEFVIGTDDLAFYDRHMRKTVEPGEFEIMVGSSSEDIRLTGSFRVRG
jgi:beta-glucosidase